MVKVGDSFKFHGRSGTVCWVNDSFDRPGWKIAEVDFPYRRIGQKYNCETIYFYVRGCVKTRVNCGSSHSVK